MKLTREGKRFLLATALISVAAVNTGNNLIYLILSLMLSFILLSYVLLRLNLAKLLLELSLEGPVFAGESAYATLRIINHKSIPAYSLNIHAPDAGTGKVYCGHVSAHGEHSDSMEMIFRKRGVVGCGAFVVRSGFPFILFEMSMPAPVSKEVLVYPRLRDMHGVVPDAEGYDAQGDAAMTGAAEEVYALREYRSGDDRRKIHWKVSAKRSGLVVKEYADYLSRKATIVVDNLLPHDEENFEKAVSAAASLSAHFIETGLLVRLVSCRKIVPFGGGEGHLLTILDILALLQEEEQCESATLPGQDGFAVFVCKSPKSIRSGRAVSADRVIYADSL